MVIFHLTSAPQRARGLLSRYCLEVRPGFFVGRLDKRMRLKLWAAVKATATPKTSAVVAWARPSAQGFGLRTLGPQTREVTRMDGLFVVVQPPPGGHQSKDEPPPTDPAAALRDATPDGHAPDYHDA